MKLLATLVTVLLVGMAGASSAQTVDEIVEKNLKAKGGVELLKATNSVRMTAKVTVLGTELPMTSMAKRPNMFRREVTIGNQPGIQASDGKAFWMMQPGGPATEIPNPPEALKVGGEFDGAFLDYKTKGTTITLIGKEPVDGKETNHLKVTTKDGSVQDMYLDVETGLERKIVTTIQQGGMAITQEQLPSDYRDVEGRMMPFRIKTTLTGTPPAEIVVEKVEFNVPIDEALFRIPK